MIRFYESLCIFCIDIFLNQNKIYYYHQQVNRAQDVTEKLAKNTTEDQQFVALISWYPSKQMGCGTNYENYNRKQ